LVICLCCFFCVLATNTKFVNEAEMWTEKEEKKERFTWGPRDFFFFLITDLNHHFMSYNGPLFWFYFRICLVLFLKFKFSKKKQNLQNLDKIPPFLKFSHFSYSLHVMLISLSWSSPNFYYNRNTIYLYLYKIIVNNQS
jgi:hypothetical protein